MLLDSKNLLNKIRQERVMSPGILIELKSAIFRRNSIFDPGSNDRIEKNKFHFDSCTQEPYPGTEPKILILDPGLYCKGLR
jgi:hypothetical protein